MTRKQTFSLPGYLPILLLFVFLPAIAAPAFASWKETVLYSFQGGVDAGSGPAGGVVFDQQGNLYVATTGGGPPTCAPIGGSCGAVYEFSPPAVKGAPWTATLIRMFEGKRANDASVPTGGLIIDDAGNLYGVTGYGGTGDCELAGVAAGCGTVYELSPPAAKGGQWTETILYSFPTSKEGYLPSGSLVFDSAGNLYGATMFGGGHGTTCDEFYQYCGAVFELIPPKTKGGAWREKVLYGFKSGTDGASPNGGLVLDSRGRIYGTTYGGGDESGVCGAVGCGTAFELDPPTQAGGAWKETILCRLEDNPSAGMIFDAKGRLYGATVGTVFRLDPPNWEETILHTFGEDAYGPKGSLIFDKNGNLYGTTNVGSGQALHGSAFRLNRPDEKTGRWTFTLLHGFPGPPDGEFPAANLTFDINGNLYSTTQNGGTGASCWANCGTVFEISP
jgi:hypothetical protein